MTYDWTPEVLDWLNGPSSAPRQEFGQMVAAVAAFNAFALERRRPGSFADPSDIPTLVKHGEKVRRLLSRLSRRKLPGVVRFAIDEAKLSLPWRVSRAGAMNVRKVGVLGDITPSISQFARLRQCDVDDCRRWYQGRSSLKRFCSKKCKKKWERQSEGYKKKHAARMKDYYRKFQSSAAARGEPWRERNEKK